MTAELWMREANKQDAVQLVGLVQKGMPGYPFESVYDQRAIEKEIGGHDSHRIVVETELGKIVATAVLAGDGPNAYMQEIKRVVVDPGLRDSGLATQMTQYLTTFAKSRGIVPWLDARGDQPGMQKAAINSGHIAISLERGKHCVYKHKAKDNNSIEVGPGRETMVHMTTLPFSPKKLNQELYTWPVELREELAWNMDRSTKTPVKNNTVVTSRLPSAAGVKNRINHALSRVDHTRNNEASDIAILENGNLRMVVVKPDASGFIQQTRLKPEDREYLRKIVCQGHEIGLQTITMYVDINNHAFDLLQNAGMSPTMVRVWQESKTAPIKWQIGWRSVSDDFEKSLHYLRIHDAVLSQIAYTLSIVP